MPHRHNDLVQGQGPTSTNKSLCPPKSLAERIDGDTAQRLHTPTYATGPHANTSRAEPKTPHTPLKPPAAHLYRRVGSTPQSHPMSEPIPTEEPIVQKTTREKATTAARTAISSGPANTADVLRFSYANDGR